MKSKLSDEMHIFSEQMLGLIRKNYHNKWSSNDFVLEVRKKNIPCGFSQMVEFEKLYYIHCVTAIEVHETTTV